MSPEHSVSLAHLRAEAVAMLSGVDGGDPLDERTEAILGLAVRVSVSALDTEGTRTVVDHALGAGVTAPQIHETLVLVAGLGMHSLIEGSRCLADALRESGDTSLSGPLDARRSELWERYVGTQPYWKQFEREVPGFLDALVRMSPEVFEAFFFVCEVPWRMATLPRRTKELIALAVDATPSHAYLPGMRLHLRSAVRQGAGQSAILRALEIAATPTAAPR